MGNPMVSVVIPTYNRKDIITRAIKSVQNQTYPNCEIIVIDDGSTDGTSERLKLFIESDEIRYFRTENLGVCSARNLGIEKARGQFISLLDSDDEYLPTRVERQLSVMLDKKLKFSLSSRNECIDGVEKKKHNVEDFLIDSYGALLSGIPLSATLMMFEKEVYSKVKFDELLSSGNDLDFVARALKDFKVIFIGEPLNIINKSLKYSRISTNYTKKIQGYKRILKKIDQKVYPQMADLHVFTTKVTYNLGLFYLFDGQYIEARRSFDRLKNITECTFKYRFKAYLLSLLSKFPSLLKFLFSVAKVFWKLGLI